MQAVVVHIDEPVGEDFPSWHGAHSVDPIEFEYVFSEHSSHGVEGFESPSHVPAMHSTQSATNTEPDGE
jgi:hypothetical protein